MHPHSRNSGKSKICGICLGEEGDLIRIQHEDVSSKCMALFHLTCLATWQNNYNCPIAEKPELQIPCKCPHCQQDVYRAVVNCNICGRYSTDSYISEHIYVHEKCFDNYLGLQFIVEYNSSKPIKVECVLNLYTDFFVDKYSSEIKRESIQRINQLEDFFKGYYTTRIENYQFDIEIKRNKKYIKSIFNKSVRSPTYDSMSITSFRRGDKKTVIITSGTKVNQYEITSKKMWGKINDFCNCTTISCIPRKNDVGLVESIKDKMKESVINEVENTFYLLRRFRNDIPGPNESAGTERVSRNQTSQLGGRKERKNKHASPNGPRSSKGKKRVNVATHRGRQRKGDTRSKP